MGKPPSTFLSIIMVCVYYTYILWSSAKRRFYIGSSSDLRKRLIEHNRGGNASTKYGTPWIVLYYEAYRVKSLAQEKERVLKKRGKAWQSLRKRINLDST